MEKLVRRGDPVRFRKWLEEAGPDPEFADTLDRIVKESREGLRLKDAR